MKIVNLLDLEPNKVSRDLRDYSSLIVGESGIGKTELAVQLYGKERSLILAFEDSASGLAGVNAVNIDSYPTLTAYLGQLTNPAVREKYDVIIIDTLFLLDFMCEKAVTDAYGVKIVKDALAYNAGYKIIDVNFLDVIKKLQRMDYTICYIAHPVTKKVKNAFGQESTKIEPKVSDRVKALLLPEVDIQLFCTYDENGNRVVYSQKTQYFDARCRVSQLPPVLPFDADIINEKFKEGVDLLSDDKSLIVEKFETKIEEEPSYEELMAKVNDLGAKANELGKLADANKIVADVLGCDDNSNPRTLEHITPQMTNVLQTIMVQLELLVG